MQGLDTIISWSFKERLEKDLDENYWSTLRKELWVTHQLSISQIIREDYSKFYLELVLLIGKKGAKEIQKKCMNDILKIHKHPQLCQLSFYDNKLGMMVLDAYGDNTSRDILYDLSGNVKCLPDVLDDGKINHNFNSTSFYRSVKKLIKNGLIIDAQQPIKREGKTTVYAQQYTSLFEKLTISIGNKIDSVVATVSNDIKKDSVILNVIENN